MRLHLGIVGDHNPGFEPHLIADAMFAHAAATSGIDIDPHWLSTDRITELALQDCAGLWIAPGSPYRSLDGALAAIRFARENQVPLGGACGGFQHVVLEYARNVLGFSDAVHAEYNPPAGSRQILTRLSCSPAGAELPITLSPGSLAAKVYDTTAIVERYYCSFGVNPEYRDRLGDLRISGWDEANEPRVVELPGHPYFLVTLFVPRSTPGSPHPLALGFLQAAHQRALASTAAG
jgi:CTP synthase (UTP-ammonia lyase)